MRLAFERLDADNRLTVIEMALCDPFAGELARHFLDMAPHSRESELFEWLTLAREVIGVEGVGHA